MRKNIFILIAAIMLTSISGCSQDDAPKTQVISSREAYVDIPDNLIPLIQKEYGTMYWDYTSEALGLAYIFS